MPLLHPDFVTPDSAMVVANSAVFVACTFLWVLMMAMMVALARPFQSMGLLAKVSRDNDDAINARVVPQLEIFRLASTLHLFPPALCWTFQCSASVKVCLAVNEGHGGDVIALEHAFNHSAPVVMSA